VTANLDHGGTGAGPAARCDFSTNANALGPNPAVVAALRAVDPTAYPDPAYTALRGELAARHGHHADEVVVGAGASELIHRVAGRIGGHDRPALVWEPTFAEYRHAAAVAGMPVHAVRDRAAYLTAVGHAAVAWLCQPNSPDGVVHDATFTAAVAERADRSGVPVVCDLAYAALAEDRVLVPTGAWELHSPNKAHGVTGVRAGYLLAPRSEAAALRVRAPSWILSAYGEAFLRTATSDAGRAWVAATRGRLWNWRDDLAAALAARGLPVSPGRANYLLVDVGSLGGATAVTEQLAAVGIAVRDATSFGLPTQLRLRAHTPDAVAALLTALDDLRARRATAALATRSTT
jgi:histidinol-phosphate aminotransferase